MHREAAWMSISEGMTGTTIECASCVSSGICSEETAAGVSTTRRSVPAGVRSANARVTPILRSKAAMPWIGGNPDGRNFSQRMLEPCGSWSISATLRPFHA